jgi:ATP-binding cassette subfamily B protein
VKHLAYLNKYLYKYKYHLILGTLFVIISNIFAIVPAQVVRYSFDLVKETIDLYFLYDSYEAQQNYTGYLPGVYFSMGYLFC